MRRAMVWVLGAVLLAHASGCAAREVGGTARGPVAEGSYASAFNAARSLLLDRGFALERVDARAGVITTAPEPTAGLATPWDPEQASLDDEVRDLLNRHRRVARVTFRPQVSGGREPGPRGQASAPEPIDADEYDADVGDLRSYRGDLVVEVRVTIERVHRPGVQLEPESARLAGLTEDTALRDRQMWPQYAVAHERDRALEQWLVEQIGDRLIGVAD